jgi:serine/threonine-protein kinase GIN4
MDYHPRLITLKVEESVAKPWFFCLVDAIRFLHAAKVSHNDIKPGNILMSEANEPILVDFGFAQSYKSSKAEDQIISSLSVGTPEYLSP